MHLEFAIVKVKEIICSKCECGSTYEYYRKCPIMRPLKVLLL